VLAQPARCERVERMGDELECTIDGGIHEPRTVRARVVIGAHGSWELGDLATQRKPASAAPGDLLAFKAHFRNSDLPPGLMPLLSFAGGYGGMAHCDDGRVSLSCCIQRSRFQRLSRGEGESAGEAVLQHILNSCPVLRPILEPARLDGPWLSVGPIQPGIRPSYRDGIFAIGNAAGEAHPVVAEGISMAMQSAWILCQHLTALEPSSIDERARQSVGRSYGQAWRRAFAPRLRTAAAVAAWAMRPKLVQAAGPLFKRFPNLLTLGARLSGKSTLVVTDAWPAAAT
jgi:menaquinone-9 beta-reductase